VWFKTVFIDDNFDYQNESERVTHGVFETADEALAACRHIVDEFLIDAFKPCMSERDVYDCYKCLATIRSLCPLI
jgi:hypothetical protein